MSEKEMVKKAVQLAEEELKDKQIQEVKKIVTATLQKLEEKKKEKLALDEEIKILKMDIDDLKDGRIDRIVERQEKDEKAKQVSVVVIIKEKIIEREVPSPWYWPYTVVWQTPIHVPYSPTWLNTITSDCDSLPCTYTDNSSQFLAINNSVAKYATVGTYDINGDIINLR